MSRFVKAIYAALIVGIFIVYMGMARTAIGDDFLQTPHQITYELSTATDGNFQGQLQGEMVVRLMKECQHWQYLSHMDVDIHFAENDKKNLKIISDTEFIESFDGLNLRFSHLASINGATTIHNVGTAELQHDGQGIANFTHPNSLEFALVPNTVFPMKQTELLLKSLATGEKIKQWMVFDGTDPVTYPASHFLVGKVAKADEVSHPFGPLQQWQVIYSIFSPDNQDSEPSETMRLNILSNGVALQANMNLAGIAVVANKRAVTKIPASICDY